MRSDFGELISEVQDADRQSGVPLGTAQWMGLHEACERLRFRPDVPSDRVWLGEAFDPDATPLGYADDRHVCLVSGTRGGKGAGVIVPNLCLWPGSCIVIDPKGENATVTARRRGGGSDHARGMGQNVRILDPFGEVPLDPSLKARFNPLDVIDPKGDLAVDDAGRIAAAIIVKENQNDPYWEDAARNLIKGLILHVLSEPIFEGVRNLVTVRRLLTQGHWLALAKLREAGDEKLPSAFGYLWEKMRRSPAFNGVVAGVGEQMVSMAEKTRSGILEMARTNTVFLDGAPMQRLLETSDFDLAALKTDPKGLTIYLTLPQRYMETHYRWLRLMVSLAIGEMERIKGRPRSGYPTLFLLDEFAGLKRMEVIEHAVAQAAGFGVKFFFVVQNLPQLKKAYEENWETFVSNSGVKAFFQIDDHFTRDYLSKLLGEREVRRETRSGSQAQSNSRSATDGNSSTASTGTSTSQSTGGSVGRSYSAGTDLGGRQRGENRGTSTSGTEGQSNGTSFSRSDSQSASTTDGWGEGVHKRPLLNPDEIGRFLARIDDRNHPAYPGLVLAVMPGQHPLVVRRVNYFEARRFAGLFDPHPNYPPPPTLIELARRPTAERTRPPAAKGTIAEILSRPVRKLSEIPQPGASVPVTPPSTFSAVETLKVLAASAAGLAARSQPKPVESPRPAKPAPVIKVKPPKVRKPYRGGSLLPLGIVVALGVAVFIKMDSGGGDALGSLWQRIVQAVPAIGATTQPTAFQQGLAARRTWENWFNNLSSGDYRDGANYWAARRSTSAPGSCFNGQGQSYGAFTDGCVAAKNFFTPVDIRRNTEPDYWRGWNNY